jgi:hypothetical protein
MPTPDRYYQAKIAGDIGRWSSNFDVSSASTYQLHNHATDHVNYIRFAEPGDFDQGTQSDAEQSFKRLEELYNQNDSKYNGELREVIAKYSAIINPARWSARTAVSTQQRAPPADRRMGSWQSSAHGWIRSRQVILMEGAMAGVADVVTMCRVSRGSKRDRGDV